MSLSKEAIQHIQETAIRPAERLVEKDGRLFEIDENGRYSEIKRREISPLKSVTLSGLVDYLLNLDYDTNDEKLYVQICNEKKVVVYSELKQDSTRDYLITAEAIVPDQNFGYFEDAEMLNIELQSKFQDSEDKGILLKVIGNIKDENVQNTSDDGVSQSVTIKQGVASVAQVKVPNPVTLLPYSTFQEIDQPERLFVFRMREGAQGALFDTDDVSWKLKAVSDIRDYLETALDNAALDIVIIG